jgi:hypothetical protein
LNNITFLNSITILTLQIICYNNNINFKILSVTTHNEKFF